MREIAIIKIDRRYCDSECSGKLETSITDWTKVSEEDYELLEKASNKLKGKDYDDFFIVVERPIDEPAHIKQTIAEYLAFEKEEKKRIEKERKEREEKKKLKELKKLAKTEAQEKQLLEDLKKKYGTTKV